MQKDKTEFTVDFVTNNTFDSSEIKASIDFPTTVEDLMIYHKEFFKYGDLNSLRIENIDSKHTIKIDQVEKTCSLKIIDKLNFFAKRLSELKEDNLLERYHEVSAAYATNLDETIKNSLSSVLDAYLVMPGVTNEKELGEKIIREGLSTFNFSQDTLNSESFNQFLEFFDFQKYGEHLVRGGFGEGLQGEFINGNFILITADAQELIQNTDINVPEQLQVALKAQEVAKSEIFRPLNQESHSEIKSLGDIARERLKELAEKQQHSKLQGNNVEVILEKKNRGR